MRLIIFSIIIILISLSIFSCGSTTETEKQEQPTVPTLVYPAELADVIGANIELDWNASSDPNGDDIEYMVYYNTAPTNWIMAGKTRNTSYTLNLEENTIYYWYISASDGNTYPVDSESRVFKTISTNTAPTASFEADLVSGTVETTFNFDANACSDEQDISSDLQIRWDFDGDGIWDTNHSTSKITSHRYYEAGNYCVILEVMDSKGSTGTVSKDLSVVLHNPAEYNGMPSSYYQNVFIENFNDNSNNWPEGYSAGKWEGAIKEGYYEITNFADADTSRFFWHKVDNLDDELDFEVETKIKIVANPYPYGNGILWGGERISTWYSIYYSMLFNNDYINNDHVFGVHDIKSSTSSDRWLGWTILNNIHGLGSYNKLTIRKFDGEYYFFINETPIGSHQFKPFYDKNIGFLVNVRTTIRADYLNISYLSQSKINKKLSNSRESGVCALSNDSRCKDQSK